MYFIEIVKVYTLKDKYSTTFIYIVPKVLRRNYQKYPETYAAHFLFRHTVPYLGLSPLPQTSFGRVKRRKKCISRLQIQTRARARERERLTDLAATARDVCQDSPQQKDGRTPISDCRYLFLIYLKISRFFLPTTPYF